MSMTNEEIVRRYQESTSPREDVKDMANQNGCKPGDIIDILVREGVDITLPEKPPVPVSEGLAKQAENSLGVPTADCADAPEEACEVVECVAPAKAHGVQRLSNDWGKGMQLYSAGASDKEIADALGCKKSVVYNWRYRRGLPSNAVSENIPVKTDKAPGEKKSTQHAGATTKAGYTYDKETIKRELESIVYHLLFAADYSFKKYLNSYETKDMYMLMEHLGEIGKIVRALSFEGNADEQAQ